MYSMNKPEGKKTTIRRYLSQGDGERNKSFITLSPGRPDRALAGSAP
jgi:hypothetical protein